MDDSVDAAESLATLVRLWGHDVRVVHDGPAAVAAARSYQPDVVLLDIGLPQINGYEVAKLLRAQAGLTGALLVAVTGYGQDEDRRRSREAGLDYHLVKPADPDSLQALLASAQSTAG